MALLSPDLSDDSFTAAFTPENHSWNSCIESYLIKKNRKENVFLDPALSTILYRCLSKSFILQEQCVKANRITVFNNLGRMINLTRKYMFPL